MKNLKTFNEFVNESKLNEAFATLEGDDVLSSTYKDYESSEDEDLDLKVMKKGFESIAKLLGGNMNNVSSTMEEGDYEFSRSLNVGLDKRFNNADPNIEKVGQVNINSPFDSSNSSTPVTCYLIKDANIKVATWNYGDDFATFDHVAYLTKDAKALLKWVNSNLSDDDMQY
jgi:hypothetical protein